MICKFNNLKLIPKIGVEIEFYVNPEQLQSYLKLMDISEYENIEKDLYVIIMQNDFKYVQNVEKEKGALQYEIQFHYTENFMMLLAEVEKIRMIFGEFADFSAKPYAQDYGSALHFHISLHSQEGDNLYAPDTEDNIAENWLLYYSLGGLCQGLKKGINAFTSSLTDYERFAPNFDAPMNISWGGNNRTTAIRIPTSSPGNRRIEHRVASANCDIYKALDNILENILLGIKNKIIPPKKTYGIARGEEYESFL